MRSLFLPLIITLLISSCRLIDNEHPTMSECNDLDSSFFQKFTATERMQNFHALGLEKQYAVYICGNRLIHPPAMYLAESFAKEGAAVVPFLMHKLSSTRQDSTVRHIVYVFSEMQHFKTYDVNGDKKLMLLLVTRTAKIENEEWREYTESLLTLIRTMAQDGLSKK
jgi:hypothetical protein